MGTGSSDTDVRVRLGADHGDLDGGLRDSVSALRNSVDQMTATVNRFAESSASASKRTQDQNRAMEFSFLRLHESIKSGFTASMTVLETWKTRIGQVGAIFTGGALFKGAVESATHLYDEVVRLENVFGMASDKATVYATALKLMGKGADDFIAMSMKLGRQLKANEGELNTLGIVTRDQQGHLLALDDIMQNAFATMQTYRLGADQDLFALKAFGRGAQEVYDYVTKLNPAIQRATKLNAELGIEMGPQRQAQIKAYKAELAATKVVFSAMAETIGEVLLPKLQAKAQWFNTHGPAAIKVFDFALKSIMSVLEIFGTGAATIAILVACAFENMATRVTMAFQLVKAVAIGAWSSLPGIVAAANGKIVSNNRAAFETIAEAGTKMRKNLDAIWTERKIPEAPGAGPMKGGNRTMPFEDKNAATRLEMWKAELDALRDAEETFHEFSKAAEMNFWASKLALAKKGTKEWAEVFHLMVEARKADQREQFANLMEDYNERITAAKNDRDAQLAIAHQRTETVKALFGEESREYKRALADEIKERQNWAAKDLEIIKIHSQMAVAQGEHDIKMEQLNLDQQVALRQVSNQQRFAMEAQFENRLYQLKLKETQDLLKAEKDGPNDPVKVAQIEGQIEALEQTHQEKLTQIHNAAVLDRKQYALQAQDAIKSSMGDFLASLTDRTKTFSEKLKALFDGLTQQLSKIASNKIIEDLFGSGTKGGDFLSGITNRMFGGGLFGALMPGETGGIPNGAKDVFGSAGRGATKNAEAAAAQQATTALTAMSTTTQAQATPSLQTMATTISSVVQSALTQLASAAESAAAALMSVGAGGGGGAFGGMGGMFGGDMGGVMSMAGPFPMFAEGTNYVPRDTLAFIHKGEAVVPAKYNSGNAQSSSGGTVHQTVNFMNNGPVDTRTQDQVAAAAYRGLQRARARNL